MFPLAAHVDLPQLKSTICATDVSYEDDISTLLCIGKQHWDHNTKPDG